MSYASEVMADSPRGWWRCREASGLIQDSSGNGNHATSQSGTITYSNPGPITSDGSASKSLFFQDVATDSLQTVPLSGTLNVGDNVSVELWFKRNRVAGPEESIFQRIGGWGIYIGGTGFHPNELYLVRSTISGVCFTTKTVTDTDWHYVMISKNGADVKFWCDGLDVTGSIVDTLPFIDLFDLTMGNIGAPNDVQFEGYVAEAAVYSGVLSQARMLAHYNAATESAGGTPTPFPPRARMIGRR